MKLGCIKANGNIDWKIFGVVLSFIILIILFVLLLMPQLLPCFVFVDKTTWVESVKYCIDKFAGFACLETGCCGAIGITSKFNKISEEDNTNNN